VGREQRRLAAIVAADAVGYSRLMGRDESGTVARLRQNRTERLDPVLERYRGRLVKLTGDGALIEFASAVDALGAAIAFQQAVAEENRGHPDDSALKFRIGLHLGDLIVEGDDLYGDGVNVAARLEAEAPAGGIVVSGTARDFIGERVKARFVDLGELALKNIERPVRAFRVKWEAADWPAADAPPPKPVTPPSASDALLSLPDKPSIAVLAFQNMSGDPEQEHFGDGIAEDIITALSRQRDFFVIARNSSFTYKGASPDIRQVGRELGVRYVLEGSVRRVGTRLRITAQLIDATTGNHLWAERYDKDTSDIFAVQDEITEAVVASIEPQLVLAEGSRSRRRTSTDLDAWSLVAQAYSHKILFSEAEARQALGLLERAVEIDPRYARAFAELAWVRVLIAYNWQTGDRTASFAVALETARKALALDPDDPVAHFARGLVFVLSRRPDEAIASLSRAVELNPNYAVATARLGATLANRGRLEEGLECTTRALRMSPRDPLRYLFFQCHAMALFAAARYGEATEWSQKSLQERPDFGGAARTRAASLALVGDVERARAACGELSRVQPEATLTWVDRSSELPEEPRRRLIEGLRLAGLPE